MWCVCQSLWDLIVHENRQIRQSKCEQKNGFLPTWTDKFLLRVVFFEVQNVFGSRKLDLKTLLTSMRQCWSSERSKHRHRELRLWQTCALHNDWTSRDDTDFYSAWTALNVIVFLSRIVHLYVMLCWMAYTCIYWSHFRSILFDTCISFFFKTCIVRHFCYNALRNITKYFALQQKWHFQLICELINCWWLWDIC